MPLPFGNHTLTIICLLLLSDKSEKVGNSISSGTTVGRRAFFRFMWVECCSLRRDLAIDNPKSRPGGLKIFQIYTKTKGLALKGGLDTWHKSVLAIFIDNEIML